MGSFNALGILFQRKHICSAFRPHIQGGSYLWFYCWVLMWPPQRWVFPTVVWPFWSHKKKATPKITPWISYVCDIFIHFVFFLMGRGPVLWHRKNRMSLILGQSFFVVWHFDTWKVATHLLFTWSKLTDADDSLGSWVTQLWTSHRARQFLMPQHYASSVARSGENSWSVNKI